MRALIVLLLACAVGNASARGYAAGVTPTPQGFNLKFASNGQPLATTSQGATTVNVTQNVPLPLSPSISLPAIAAAAVGGASVGGAIGAAIATVGAVTVVALPALADAFVKAKARVTSTGSLEIADPAVCTSAPCYQYALGGKPWRTTKLAACKDISYTNTAYYYKDHRVSETGGNGGFGYCIADLYSVSNNVFQTTNTESFYRLSVSPSPVSYVPATTEQVVQAISANAPTVAEVQALIDLNFPPEVTTPTVTGPAEVVKGNTVELGLDGTVKQIEERYIASYGPGWVNIGVKKTESVTTPPKTSTTTTTNADGTTSTAVTVTPSTTTTNVSTSTQRPDSPTELGTLSDTAFADLPVLYTRKYPDGLVGIWNTKIAAIKAAPLFTLVGSLMPTVAASGTCPAWTVDLSFSPWANYGGHDVAPACWLWDFGKVVILLSAALLCRRLIFGG